MCGSCIGPGYGSRHTSDSSQPQGTPASADLIPSSGSMGICTRVCMSTRTHKIYHEYLKRDAKLEFYTVYIKWANNWSGLDILVSGNHLILSPRVYYRKQALRNTSFCSVCRHSPQGTYKNRKHVMVCDQNLVRGLETTPCLRVCAALAEDQVGFSSYTSCSSHT